MGNPATTVLDAITDQVAAAVNPRDLPGLPEDDLLAVLAATERLGPSGGRAAGAGCGGGR